MKRKPFYRVIVDRSACKHCKQGKSWVVVDRDGVSGGISYGERWAADEECNALNAAYDRGYADGILLEPK